MANRDHESELLAWIEGEPLSPEAAERLQRAFEADSSLLAFAEAAKSDRTAIRALAEIDAQRAPTGMVSSAMEIAEREALVGDAPVAARKPQRRIQVTPFRFVAAAGLVITAGAASVIGFLMNAQPDALPMASAGGESATVEPLDAGTIDDVVLLAEAAPETLVGSEATALKSATAPEVAMAFADMASGDALSRQSRAASSPADAIRIRLIQSTEHAPERAIAPERAATLAEEGRLLLLIRADDPAAVESALLGAAASEDPTAARWRSLLPDGEASAMPDAPARVVVADALALSSALERLLAVATRASDGVQGAWLQEMAEPVKLETPFVAEDLMWWELPPTAWATRVAVPVLIERIDPNAP